MKYTGEINVDKELIQLCNKDFDQVRKMRGDLVKDENILNDFLLELNEFKLLEIRDLVK